MFKKIVVGVAVVGLSLGIALPAAAESKVAESQAVALTPGIFCIWFGWC
ncbi:MAG TPA: hypothetical protein VNQ52_06010 [Microbacteriaceae bacterium]|nr:hypothetical protein [Microbacteriaceae bacterium]